MRPVFLAALIAIAIAPAASTQAGPGRSVVINRVALLAATIKALEQQYRTAIPNGRYWYDRVSGAWGLEGGPALGFTATGLALGGPLPSDISGKGTGVFINGRELHPQDVAGLQQLTGPIAPARYWLDGQGNAGYEGGPAITNLRVLATQLYRQNGGVGENYGGGGSAYGNLNTGIGIITDGQGGAAVFNH